MKDPEISSVSEKLDILIKLQALNISLLPNVNQRDVIVRLYHLGLKPKNIAEVLNTTQNTVNVTISTHKKGPSKNG